MGTSLKTDGSSKKQVLLASCIFMGLGHIIYLKQYLKGILFAVVEVFMLFMSPKLLNMLKDMIELSRWYKGITPAYTRMIDGLLAIAIIAFFVVLYIVSVRSALSSYQDFCLDGRVKTNKESMQGVGGAAFPFFGLAPALVLIVVFVIIPLVFSILTGFTNWTENVNPTPGTRVGWVGLDNYFEMFGGDATWFGAFGRVAIWTVLWGVLSTFTCYMGGMVLAVLLYEAKLKITPVLRAILILPYAVPSILTVQIWSKLLYIYGPVNKLLRALGIIDQDVSWMTDPEHVTRVKVICILINMWVGVPYFMLLITGQMTAISQDVYEAAMIDGANKLQVFTSITLPLVIYQTAPLIILSFTHNINNFGAIYFLTGGSPGVADSTTTQAGSTDILVTWIYKLTINNGEYGMAAVLAMLVFLVMAPFAIWNFRNTKSYKEGEL